MTQKIIAAFLFILGIIDFMTNHAGYNIWHNWFNIELPETLKSMSGFIILTIGSYLFTGNLFKQLEGSSFHSDEDSE